MVFVTFQDGSCPPADSAALPATGTDMEKRLAATVISGREEGIQWKMFVASQSWLYAEPNVCPDSYVFASVQTARRRAGKLAVCSLEDCSGSFLIAEPICPRRVRG